MKQYFLGLLLSVFSFISPYALAAITSFEPDNFSEGTDLSAAFPNITLSVVGRPDRQVHAVNGFSSFNDKSRKGVADETDFSQGSNIESLYSV